jgi:CRP-like cAMP-binding protein
MAHPHPQSESIQGERNALLRSLEAHHYRAVAPHLEEVHLRPGDILVEPGAPFPHVYFPQSGVVSLVALFEGGGAVEVGTVGWEGMAGIPVYLGVETSAYRVIMQVEGKVRRMPAEEFQRAVAEIPGWDAAVADYVDAYLMQVSQTAACNRMHDLAQRAARWLLITHDRVASDSFALTHEFLAIMLGVRRAGVSEAAAELQRKGAIRYSRGRVTVTDRAILMREACECYAAVRARFDAGRAETESRTRLAG